MKLSKYVVRLKFTVVCSTLACTISGALATNWETTIHKAFIARKMGRFTDAEKLYQQSLKQAEQFKEGDPRLAVSIGELANLYFKQGDLVKAEQYYQRELLLALQSDHDQPAQLRDLYILALIAEKRGAFAQSELYYRRACPVAEKIYGARSTQLSDMLKRASYQCQLQKKYPQAEELLFKAINIERKARPDGMESAHLGMQLAALFREQEKYYDCGYALRKALDVVLKHKRQDDPYTILVYYAQALNYASIRDFEHAMPIFKKCIEKAKVTDTASNLTFSEMLKGYGKAYTDQNNYDSAIPLYQRAWGIQKKILNPTDGKLAETAMNLADAQVKKGNFATAKSVLNEFLKIARAPTRHEFNQAAIDKVRKKLEELQQRSAK